MYTSCPFPEEMPHVAFWKVKGFLGNPRWYVSVQCLVGGISARHSQPPSELLAVVLQALAIRVSSADDRRQC